MSETELTKNQSRVLRFSRTVKGQQTVVGCCNCGSTAVETYDGQLHCVVCGNIGLLNTSQFYGVAVKNDGNDREADAVLDFRRHLEKIRPQHVGRRPRILIAGPGESGKDTAARWFGENTTLRYSHSTSWYLCKAYAASTDRRADVVYEDRRNRRQELYDFGCTLRADAPGHIIDMTLRDNEVICGVRETKEVVYAREKNIVDLVLWVKSDRAADDPTMEFGPDLCDVIVENNGTVDELAARLGSLSRLLGYAP